MMLQRTYTLEYEFLEANILQTRVLNTLMMTCFNKRSSNQVKALEEHIGIVMCLWNWGACSLYFGLFVFPFISKAAHLLYSIEHLSEVENSHNIW